MLPKTSVARELIESFPWQQQFS